MCPQPVPLFLHPCPCWQGWGHPGLTCLRDRFQGMTLHTVPRAVAVVAVVTMASSEVKASVWWDGLMLGRGARETPSPR